MSRSLTPFRVLVRLFASRIFQGNSTSEDSELDLGVGLIFALLALPGAFYSFMLLEKYSTLLQWMQGRHQLDPLASALPDEYFFIVLSMVVTGVVAVWRWDSIFPDRRDYANLVPLPISLRNVFLANLTAIVLLAAFLALDVNAVSAPLFPLIVSASENNFGLFLHFAAVHASVVLLASIFSFCAVFVLVGALMTILPYSVFRQVSSYLRIGLLTCFVALLSTSFAVPPILKNLPESLTRFLPPVWFLGLCQLLRGRASESLAGLGYTAIAATASGAVVGIAIYIAAYRRYFVQIPEMVDAIPAVDYRHTTWLFRIADRVFLRTPFERAGYRFTIHTLLRSERHGLIFGGFLGFGIVFASQLLFSSFRGSGLDLRVAAPQILAIPLALSYCTILGMRFAFEIPAELRANWTFRFGVDPTRNECPSLAQKVILSPVLACIVLLVLPVYSYFWGWRTGIVHAAVVTVCSVLLVRIILRGYRKIPFACSYPPFAQSAVVMLLLYLMGFFAFVVGVSHLEPWIIAYPGISAIILAGLFLLIGLLRHMYHEEVEIERGLLFDEGVVTGFELINLRKES